MGGPTRFRASSQPEFGPFERDRFPPEPRIAPLLPDLDSNRAGLEYSGPWFHIVGFRLPLFCAF